MIRSDKELRVGTLHVSIRLSDLFRMSNHEMLQDLWSLEFTRLIFCIDCFRRLLERLSFPSMIRDASLFELARIVIDQTKRDCK